MNRQDASRIVEKIKSGDSRALEEAILFLNEDPYLHGSGYVKEELWRAVPHAQLTQRQPQRLQQAALKYLTRRIGREFWPMCRAMAQLANPEFRVQVDEWILRRTGVVQRRAQLLRAYLDGVDHGELARMAFLGGFKSVP